MRYIVGKWEVDIGLIEAWLAAQDVQTIASVLDALRVLEEFGPSLGRPLVDRVKGSKLQNMKELRPASPGDSEIRVLFAFDSSRRAVMLLAGDKAHGKNNLLKWGRWYRKNIPVAERLYEEHLSSLKGEGNVDG